MPDLKGETLQEPFQAPAQEETPIPQARLSSSASAPALTAGTGQPSTTELKQGFAYKEAMERHVKSLEQRAAEAVAEHDAWNNHMAECLEQEREEILSRRYRAK